MKADGEQGQWLRINKSGNFIPEFITNLPENFTLEFDLICNEHFSFYSTPFTLMILSGSDAKQAFEYSFIEYAKRSGASISLHPHNVGSNGGSATIKTFENGAQVIDYDLKTTLFNSENGNTKIRASL